MTTAPCQGTDAGGASGASGLPNALDHLAGRHEVLVAHAACHRLEIGFLILFGHVPSERANGTRARDSD